MPKVDIGPGELNPGTGRPFLMSKPEFLAVQIYVDAGTRLPGSLDDLRIKLGISAEMVSEFRDLVEVYNPLKSHCANFKDKTFPATVDLSGDIVHYNGQVKTYYGALLPIIAAWEDGKMPADKAEKKLSEILKVLCRDAEGYADRAKKIQEEIHRFVEDTKADQDNLKPVKKRYENEYDLQHGKKIQQYNEMIENAKREIKRNREDYEEYVVIASTTPTYAWIFPAGTIAAGVVAGVYGDKAVKALEKVHEYEDKLEDAEEGLRQAITLSNDLKLAGDSLDGILEKLEKALPVLQKMEGIWSAIASDLKNVLKIIDENIEKASVYIKELGVQAAIDAWAEVAKIANDYRANAFVSIKSQEEIKKEVKKNPKLYVVPTKS